MLKKLSQILIVALLLAAVGFVAYLRIPIVQDSVNTRLPQLKQPLTNLAVTLHQMPDSGSTTDSTTSSQPNAPAAPGSNATNDPATTAPSSAPAQSGTLDLAQLSQSRLQWPKSVTLKKAVQFPAVLDGKIVGNVQAPAGSQAHLVLIKDGKLGLEYQGGGAMVDVNDTDLADIVLASRR
jgi:hypothetical protein